MQVLCAMSRLPMTDHAAKLNTANGMLDLHTTWSHVRRFLSLHYSEPTEVVKIKLKGLSWSSASSRPLVHIHLTLPSNAPALLGKGELVEVYPAVLPAFTRSKRKTVDMDTDDLAGKAFAGLQSADALKQAVLKWAKRKAKAAGVAVGAKAHEVMLGLAARANKKGPTPNDDDSEVSSQESDASSHGDGGGGVDDDNDISDSDFNEHELRILRPMRTSIHSRGGGVASGGTPATDRDGSPADEPMPIADQMDQPDGRDGRVTAADRVEPKANIIDKWGPVTFSCTRQAGNVVGVTAFWAVGRVFYHDDHASRDSAACGYGREKLSTDECVRRLKTWIMTAHHLWVADSQTELDHHLRKYARSFVRPPSAEVVASCDQSGCFA